MATVTGQYYKAGWIRGFKAGVWDDDPEFNQLEESMDMDALTAAINGVEHASNTSGLSGTAKSAMDKGYKQGHRYGRLVKYYIVEGYLDGIESAAHGGVVASAVDEVGDAVDFMAGDFVDLDDWL